MFKVTIERTEVEKVSQVVYERRVDELDLVRVIAAVNSMEKPRGETFHCARCGRPNVPIADGIDRTGQPLQTWLCRKCGGREAP